MATDMRSPQTRRTVMGAALGGLAAWVASAVARPAVADANDGDALILGQSNTEQVTTSISNTDPGNGGPVLEAINPSGDGVRGTSSAAYGVGVRGEATSTAGTDNPCGVRGDAAGPGGIGVRATGAAYGLWAECDATGGFGIYASAPDPSGNAYGVWGYSESTGVFGCSGARTGVIGYSGVVTMGAPPPTPRPKTGVFGISRIDASSVGVRGESTTGTGVQGVAPSGIDLAAAGSGRLLQAPTSLGGPPTTAAVKGEQIRDAGGRLWLCTVAGTPGTWVRAATVPSGAIGGALVLLPVPGRVYDSRYAGGPLVAGATRTVSVASAIASTGGGIVVPPGAVGIAFNLTITGTVGSGWLAVIPRGATFRGTSSINWSASGQTIANGGVVGLGGDRLLDVRCGAGSGGSTHFLIDVTGYYL